MSDSSYFACLALVAACAVIAPVYASRVVSGRQSLEGSVILAVASITGIAASLPFWQTREMPWLPVAAGSYFLFVNLAAILFAVAKILQAVSTLDRPGAGRKS